MAAIVLLLIAFNLRDRPVTTRRLSLLGLVGFLVICFSQASVLVMAGLGFAFAVDWFWSRDQKALRPLLLMVPYWAAASIIAVMIGAHSMMSSTPACLLLARTSLGTPGVPTVLFGLNAPNRRIELVCVETGDRSAPHTMGKDLILN
jgi:hypothetical protein